MTEAVLRLPARLRSGRRQISPVLLSLSLAPIGVIFLLVLAMFWVSFQRGVFGTATATYTLENYREILTDPFELSYPHAATGGTGEPDWRARQPRYTTI